MKDRKKYVKNLIGMFALIITLSGLLSCELQMKFDSEVIEYFMDDLKEEYGFIDSTKVYKSQKGIVLKIYFDSVDQTFDEAVYKDLKVFFWDIDVQNEIIEAYDKKHLEGDNYPTIWLYFIDKSNSESHRIETPVEYVDYKAEHVMQNRYLEWHSPTYIKGLK